MYKLPGTLSGDIDRFAVLTKDFQEGRIQSAQFRMTRVPMGVYEQRKDGVYMVRIRTTGGFIYPSQFLELIHIGIKHQSNLLHITTRQEIQIQNLELKEVESILRELKEIGLSSKGGGGNTTRNILVDVRSGINEGEVFDPTEDAMALTTKLIAEPDSFTMPRKLKIAFSDNENHTDYAAVNDIGFIAKIKDGKRGFKVYMGGSVAPSPTVGWNLSDFIPEENLFSVVDAVKKFFSDYGNRKNKHKARLRFIFYKLGEKEVFRLWEIYYKKALETNPVFHLTQEEPYSVAAAYRSQFDEKGEAFESWKKRYVNAQRQKGLNTVIIPVIHGNIWLNEEDNVRRYQDFLQFVSKLGKDTIRFSTLQNLHLRNIPDAALEDLFHYVKNLSSDIQKPLIINNIVSCTGADTCRLGICFSKGLVDAVRKALENSRVDLDKVSNLSIHVSGCPNSCGQPTWADLGFSGKVLHNDRIYPGYAVYAGANKGKNPKLAEKIGDINAHDVPELVVHVLQDYIDKTDRYATFESYIDKEGKTLISDYLKEHEAVPKFETDNRYYYDWGSNQEFSIAERGVGECSAGLFDMIDLDKKNVTDSQKFFEKAKDKKEQNKYLYDIIYYSSRMLLVTRGGEPKKEKEVFDLFSSLFIDADLVSPSFREIIILAKNVPDFDFTTKKEEVYALAKTVFDLYDSMDDSLQFKNLPDTSAGKGITEKKEEKNETLSDSSYDRSEDLRGVACPMNFVKTKIFLSSMKAGQTLEILLDDGQPIQNVPGSVKNEGHEIIEQTKIENYWKVVIKKR